jgi:hypothetical protein
VATALAGGALVFPAAASLPSAGASAEVTKDCSEPRFVKYSHTRYCPNYVSHWTHNYVRSSVYLSGGWWHTCYHFSSYGWFIGCQDVVGPFSKSACN